MGGGPGGGGMQDDGSLLQISGGTLVVDAGGDGLDSNGSTEISGGTIVVSGPTSNGNGSLDSNGGITVTGGTVVAAGSAGMAESPNSASTTGWLQVNFNPAVAAGETLSIVSDGKVLASFTTTKEVANLVFASPDLSSTGSYDIYLGGTLASDKVGTFSAGGSIDGAASLGTVTAGQATGGMR